MITAVRHIHTSTNHTCGLGPTSEEMKTTLTEKYGDLSDTCGLGPTSEVAIAHLTEKYGDLSDTCGMGTGLIAQRASASKPKPVSPTRRSSSRSHSAEHDVH